MSWCWHKFTKWEFNKGIDIFPYPFETRYCRKCDRKELRGVSTENIPEQIVALFSKITQPLFNKGFISTIGVNGNTSGFQPEAQLKVQIFDGAFLEFQLRVVYPPTGRKRLSGRLFKSARRYTTLGTCPQ